MSFRRGGRGDRIRHPPGLKGKAIGLFYRDLQKKNPKQKDKCFVINLKIPQPVLQALYNNLKSIEKIAQKENIDMPPKKKLLFQGKIEDCYGADFIPLRTEKMVHTVTNIHKRDDDVLFVGIKNPESEIISLDSDLEDMVLDSNVKQENENVIDSNNSESTKNIVNVIKKETTTMKNGNPNISNTEHSFNIVKEEMMPVKNENFASETENKAYVKQETTSIKNEYYVGEQNSSNMENKDFFVKEEITPVKNEYHVENNYGSEIENIPNVVKQEESLVKNEYFVDNNYGPSSSGTSMNPSDNPSDNNLGDNTNDYKYGYDDIITGSFQEKLEESLKNGVDINLKNEESDDLSLALKEELISTMDIHKYKDMMKFREKLPTYKKSEELIKVINDNQIIVISGETGCGKSTQIPQLILDDAIMNDKGAYARILVTQPRRIAASSLAIRVAEERAEKPGNSVGYAIRLEKVDSRPRGSIMFCTTGVLLVELEISQGLTNYSHVILDEVHERDCNIDIAMCMLKQVLQVRKDLKLILMSATIDAERICTYFNDCPLIHIEGLAYPVQDVYLEDILQMIKYQLSPDDGHNNKKHFHGRRREKSQMEKDIQYRAEIGPWLEANKNKFDKEVYKTLQDSRIELLDVNLVLELLKYLCKGSPGAILVFLPGFNDITKLIRIMKESRLFPEHKFDIHPLHSKLSTITQHKIFKRPPDHIRKIIIATNIAETSITVDDIVYVIDCGKIKYNGLNVEENISTLQVEWASQANLRQRRGRAGRCQPGICYHLVTSFRAQRLEERLLPELQRSNLFEPVLAIKKLRLGLAEEALKMMPGVPAEKTIRSAVRHLQQCGALDEKETLTPLGWHLARLPVHPAAGKLVVLGALFGCLDRAASVATVWGFKDPFNLVMGKEREVDATKKSFTLGEPSDHVAFSEAIIQWENCSSYSEKSNFAYQNFLSMNTLGLLSEMKKQLGRNLKQMGLLKSDNVKSDWENRNSENMSLFKAIVAASLYPNIATVRWMNKDLRNIRKPQSIKTRTPEEGPISLHPSSVMFSPNYVRPGQYIRPLCANPGANWLVYWLKQRSSELFLIDVTLVYTLPLLFFGELNVTQADNSDECLISISTIQVCCKKETTQLLFELRSLLDKVLASKIMVTTGQTQKYSYFEEQVLNAVIDLITAEDERAEYFDDDDEDSEQDGEASRKGKGKRKRYWRFN